jgi:hypothetical protein
MLASKAATGVSYSIAPEVSTMYLALPSGLRVCKGRKSTLASRSQGVQADGLDPQRRPSGLCMVIPAGSIFGS